MTSNENQSKLLKYKMDHAKRGKALVININKYEPPKNETNSSKNEPKEREWSKQDVDNLTNTLNYLEFDLDLVENLKKEEIEKL